MTSLLPQREQRFAAEGGHYGHAEARDPNETIRIAKRSALGKNAVQVIHGRTGAEGQREEKKRHPSVEEDAATDFRTEQGRGGDHARDRQERLPEIARDQLAL